MPYATLEDMVTRFGETEMIRISAPDSGPLPDAPDEESVTFALTDATATIESYLRPRYQLPIANPTSDLIRAACHLARYDLASGGGREPSDTMRKNRDEAIGWLKMLSDGRASLEGAAQIVASPSSTARTQDRQPTFGPDQFRGW